MTATRNTIIALTLALSLALGACANKAQNGALMGATAGTAIGALTAGNKVEGALIGAGLGLMLGYMVGNEMDKYDQQQVTHALEYAPSGQPVSWRNPDSGGYYEATPAAAYQAEGRIYRDIQIESVIDGRSEMVHAKAYRNPDGSWQLVQ